MVDLELVIDWLCVELLDLVVKELSALDLLEVPSYQEVACRCHDRAFFPCRCVVVESGWLEADVLDGVLCNIFWPDHEFGRVRLLFAHAVLKASLAVCARRWDKQQVSLGRSQNPVSIPTHLKMYDMVA